MAEGGDLQAWVGRLAHEARQDDASEEVRPGAAETEEEDDVEESDEEELAWWEVGGDFFGVVNPNLAPIAAPEAATAEPLLDAPSAPSHAKRAAEGVLVVDEAEPADDVAVEGEPCKKKHKKQKHRKIPAEKLALYESFTAPRAAGSSKRLPVSPEAHLWMVTRLQSWQQAEGQEPWELPAHKEWLFKKCP